MKPQTLLLDLIKRYPSLKPLRAPLEAGFHLLREGFQQSGKWLIAGNGGSASDADHIAGEWLKAFMIKQPPTNIPEELACHLQHALPAIPLANFIGLHTAFGNDCDPKWTFAQLTYALGKQGDGSGGTRQTHEGALFDGAFRRCVESTLRCLRVCTRRRNVQNTGITSADLSLLVPHD